MAGDNCRDFPEILAGDLDGEWKVSENPEEQDQNEEEFRETEQLRDVSQATVL